MENTVSFALEENVNHINFEDYNDAEFAIAKLGFLSTRPNSHGLEISEEVLRNNASSALGKWLVAKMNIAGTDATSHLPSEHIMGIIPKDQDIEFVQDDDGYLRAYADVVVSKIYSKDFCNIFATGEDRAVSVEMQIDTENGKSMNDIVNAFNIMGVTVLGATVNPSCPESNIEFVRFAENAESYFGEARLTASKNFAENAKTYKIDKSKDALSDKAWGDVDKTDLRNKILEASNKNSLIKEVYLLVEDGWEEAPSEHLKYPVMELIGDTFVYNRGGLASALGYAEKENESSVVNKIKKIYKSLGIEETGKEGESEMAELNEIEFAAVNIGEMWGKLYDALHAKYPDGDYGSVYYVSSIYEEGNQKFAIIQHKDEDAMYRLNFSLTEEGLTLSDEIIKIEIDIVESDEIRKFAEPENVEQYKTFAKEEKKEEGKENPESEAEFEEEDKKDSENENKAENSESAEEEEKKAEMSTDEMTAKIAQLEEEIASRDNIIMEKENELTELRAYKQACMEAERATKVDAVMEKYAGFMDEKTAKSYKNEGLECEFSALDGWANKVAASVTDSVIAQKQAKKDNEEFTRMSAVNKHSSKVVSSSALERLKERNN